MAVELIPNELDAGFDDRALNKAEADLAVHLQKFKRDLDIAEARALNYAGSLGSNAETRAINKVLYLAGDLPMSEEQKEAVDHYQRILGVVEKDEYDLALVRAEQRTRRHERLEASTQAQQALADAGIAFPRAA